MSAENPKLLLVVAAPFKYHPSIHYYLYLAKGEGAMLTCDILIQELEVGLVVTAPFNLNTTLPSTTSYITWQGQNSNVDLQYLNIGTSSRASVKSC